jgi:ribosomal protein S21
MIDAFHFSRAGSSGTGLPPLAGIWTEEKMEVLVRDNNIEKAIYIFRSKVEHSGLLKEIKGRMFHLTRTQRRKVKDQVAKRRLRKYGEDFKRR